MSESADIVRPHRLVRLRCLVAGLVCLATVSAALAVPITPSKLRYEDSFRLKSIYGDYGWGRCCM